LPIPPMLQRLALFKHRIGVSWTLDPQSCRLYLMASNPDPAGTPGPGFRRNCSFPQATKVLVARLNGAICFVVLKIAARGKNPALGLIKLRGASFIAACVICNVSREIGQAIRVMRHGLRGPKPTSCLAYL